MSKLLRETNSSPTSHIKADSDKEHLYDFLDMNCDVESLSKIWEKTPDIPPKDPPTPHRIFSRVQIFARKNL